MLLSVYISASRQRRVDGGVGDDGNDDVADRSTLSVTGTDSLILNAFLSRRAQCSQ